MDVNEQGGRCKSGVILDTHVMLFHIYICLYRWRPVSETIHGFVFVDPLFEI